jgi:hypothetical protein
MELPGRLGPLDLDHAMGGFAMWDQLNGVLARAVQPDGSILNLERELKAGRLPLDEYRDLMTFRPSDLTIYDAGSVVKSARQFGLDDDFLRRLEDQGNVRFTYGGGIDLLGRHPVTSEILSVKRLSPEFPLVDSKIQGFSNIRPVIHGDPASIVIERDPLAALRINGRTGRTVVVDDFLSGRWSEPSGTGQLVQQAGELWIPRTNRADWTVRNPTAARAYDARYEQMLDICGRDKVHLR